MLFGCAFATAANVRFKIAFNMCVAVAHGLMRLTANCLLKLKSKCVVVYDAAVTCSSSRQDVKVSSVLRRKTRETVTRSYRLNVYVHEMSVVCDLRQCPNNAALDFDDPSFVKLMIVFQTAALLTIMNNIRVRLSLLEVE